MGELAVPRLTRLTRLYSLLPCLEVMQGQAQLAPESSATVSYRFRPERQLPE